MKSALIIPVLNAAPWLGKLLPALQSLEPRPDKILFIDSSSTDGTAGIIRNAGFDACVIRREDFGHGRTRNLGAELCADCDILVYMTQDALPASSDIIEKLTREFNDPAIAIICGRQYPHEDASVAARYARFFNYPSENNRAAAADIQARGIKALFCSNSFAAYRASSLKAVGGFPEHLPMGEDMAVTGRILEAGYSSLYLAEAGVYHSHNYSATEEFRRYFDIGALLKIDPWLRKRSLKSGGAGLFFFLGELKFTAQEGTLFDLIAVFPRTFAKYAGFQLGRFHEKLPRRLLPYFSMHGFFWRRAA